MNFSYGDEGERFYNVIQNRIKSTTTKTTEQVKPTPQIQPQKDIPAQKPNAKETNKKADKKNEKTEKKDLKKKVITKIEIGRPVGFTHVSGISISENKGFEVCYFFCHCLIILYKFSIFILLIF